MDYKLYIDRLKSDFPEDDKILITLQGMTAPLHQKIKELENQNNTMLDLLRQYAEWNDVDERDPLNRAATFLNQIKQ